MLRRPFLVAVIAGLLVGGCSPSDDAMSDETTVTVSETTVPTSPGSVEPVEPIEIGNVKMALSAGETYVTSSTRNPQLRFVAPASGWSGSDSLACPDDLGTLILVGEKGRMFVVLTANMEVDDAIAVLADSRFTSTSLTEVQIGDWSGQRFSRVLDLGEPAVNIGGKPGRSLLPYHTVTEDVLDSVDGGPSIPGSDVEINVLDTDNGILSVALVAEAGGMNAFSNEALALARTIEFVSSEEGMDSTC